MKIVAIIAAKNEGARLRGSILDARPYVTDVVVVDDGSIDDTFGVAAEAGAHVLRHVVNRGQGASLQTGTTYALERLGADILVHFDADGQMMGSEIPLLIEPIMKGEAEIVLGSRFLGKEAKDMPKFRRAMLKVATFGTIFLSGIKVTDTHNGFRALSRKAAGEIKITLDRMAHASEILDLIKAKRLKYVERPVTITYSVESLAKGQSTLKAMSSITDMLKKKIFGE
jgi:glycosyltransferase involved in cell wall biosynthesis